jgi:hypothetical protein
MATSKALELIFGINIEGDVGIAGRMPEGAVWDRAVHYLGGPLVLHFGLVRKVWHLILHFKLIILYDSINSSRIKYSSEI